MISTDFAPNETITDALLSIKLILQPWKWLNGQECDWIKKRIKTDFPKSKVFLFLTGRSALFNLLKSLNFTPMSEVIVQAFTCEAVILPILANKLKPVYIDIETTSFSMNPIDLENKITKNTKVVILQHTYGLDPINRKKIYSLINQHKLLLIEDIAHSSLILNLKFKILNSAFLLSFGRSKALSSVFGSAIVMNHPNLIKQLNKQYANCKYPNKRFIFQLLLYKPLTVLIKQTYDLGLGKILHKIFNRINLLIPEITSREKSGQYEKMFDYKYPNVLACLLKHQFNKLDKTNKLRAQICSFYSHNINTKIINHPSSIIYQPLIRYPLLIKNRDDIIKIFRKKNIFLGKWYDQVVAPKSLDLTRVGYTQGNCQIAEDACKKIINLPTNINIKQANEIVRILNDVI